MTIDARDAMTALAKQLPDDGITFREFVTRAARMCGDSDEVSEETIRLAEEEDGIMADAHCENGLCWGEVELTPNASLSGLPLKDE